MTTGKALIVNPHEIKDPELAMRSNFDDKKFSELVDSIQKLGLIQPITIFRKNKQYEVVAGHRRLQAVKALNMTAINCILVNPPDGNIEVMKIHENIIREDVNIIDEGEYYKELRDKHKISIVKLAEMIHKSDKYVEKRIATTEWQPYVKKLVLEDRVSYAVGKELNRIQEEAQLMTYSGYVIQSGASGNVVKKWVDEMLDVKELNTEVDNKNGEQQSSFIAPDVKMECGACNDQFNFQDTRLVRLCKKCCTAAQL